MSNGFIEVAIVVAFISGILGLGFNAAINDDIRKRDCRIELASQTKLDTANILLICNGAKL